MPSSVSSVSGSEGELEGTICACMHRPVRHLALIYTVLCHLAHEHVFILIWRM